MTSDEIWVTKDGRRIPVADMSEDHVRNALRMILRKRRLRVERIIRQLDDVAFAESDGQDELNAQAYRDLANPKVFFPLLEGGVYGSPDLQKRHGR
jgi:hypothetical protein